MQPPAVPVSVVINTEGVRRTYQQEAERWLAD
jgi:hypothetical protein